MIRATHRWLLAALLAAALWVASCGAARGPVPAIAGDLVVAAPASIAAGEALPVTVTGSALPEGAVVVLSVLTSDGVHLLEAPAADGRAILVVPGDLTRVAGVAALTASAGEARGRAAVTIQGAGPISPLTPLVGPHTVIANGRDESMAVVIPFDAHGNAVADGTTLRLRIQYPDLRVITRTVLVSGGVAWVRVPGGTRAGRIVISAESGAGRSMEADLIAVAGGPERLEVRAEPRSASADGRQIIALRTAPIRDGSGNLVSDGTLVRFVARMPDQTLRSIPAYTIDGVAEAPLQAPDVAGVAEVVVVVRDRQSQPERVTFTPGPAVGRIAVSVAVDLSAQKLRVTAGPIVGAIGQLVPDGTLVELVLTDAAGVPHVSSARTELGVADTLIELHGVAAGPAQIVVTVGAGRGEATIAIPQE